jgi:histidine ammonia-lyase
MQGRAPAGGPLKGSYDLAAAVLDPRVEDRPLDGDIAAAADLLDREEFSAGVGPGDPRPLALW